MSRFCEAVAVLEGLSGDDCQVGLRALGGDSERIRPQRPRNLTGSVNLDAALRRHYPSDSRWDYGIGYRENRAETAVWVEVHPARTSNVKEVLRKLEWLKARIAENPELSALTNRNRQPFRWVASGKIAISRNAPQMRMLDANGLARPCKVLILP